MRYFRILHCLAPSVHVVDAEGLHALFSHPLAQVSLVVQALLAQTWRRFPLHCLAPSVHVVIEASAHAFSSALHPFGQVTGADATPLTHAVS